MDIAIQIPEDLARLLAAKWGDLPRRMVEALAVEAYRSGVITAAQVQRMLGLSSRWEVEAFLKERHAYLDYSDADLERDIEAIRKASPR